MYTYTHGHVRIRGGQSAVTSQSCHLAGVRDMTWVRLLPWPLGASYSSKSDVMAQSTLLSEDVDLWRKKNKEDRLQ